MPRPRNYVARSPLMRKGGAHIESKTGKRVRERLALEDALDEWFDEEPDNNEEDNKGEQLAPLCFFTDNISEAITGISILYDLKKRSVLI